MIRKYSLLLGMACAGVMFLGLASADSAGRARAPIYGVQLPENYRAWPVIAVAQEAEPLHELRVILGNAVALEAYRNNIRPFPEGSVLVKLAWKQVPSPDFASASIPGEATTVQVMVKNRTRYAASGGWGYGRFIDSRPVDEAQHQTCHACHAGRVKDRDYVFTRLAP